MLVDASIPFFFTDEEIARFAATLPKEMPSEHKEGGRRGARLTRRRRAGAALAPFGELRQSGGKLVIAFAAAMNFDPTTISSNRIEIDWPLRSGR